MKSVCVAASFCLLMVVSQAVPTAYAQKGAPPAKAPAAAMTFEQTLELGQREKQAGHLAKAEELTLAAMKMAEAKKDPMQIILATNSMAGVYRWQGKYKDALAMYEKVQKLMIDAKQETSPGMATILDNQATVLDDMQDFERAANVRKEAIRIYEQGGPSRDLAMVYANQANNFHSLKLDGEAETAAKKAIAIYDQVKMKDSPEMAIALDALGGILKTQRKFDEAEKMQKQALGLLEKAYGVDSPDVAITLGNLAHTESLLGHWDEAKKMMERSVRICQQVYGPAHEKTKAAQQQLQDLIAAMPAPASAPAAAK